jgi:hypothetical protein
MSSMSTITLTRAQRRAAEKLEREIQNGTQVNGGVADNQGSHGKSSSFHSTTSLDQTVGAVMDLTTIKSPSLPNYSQSSDGKYSMKVNDKSAEITSNMRPTMPKSPHTPGNQAPPPVSMTHASTAVPSSLEELLGPISMLLTKNPDQMPNMTSTPEKNDPNPNQVEDIFTEDASNRDVMATIRESFTKLTQLIDGVRNDLSSRLTKAIDDVRTDLGLNLKGFEERLGSIESALIRRHDDLTQSTNAKIADIVEIARVASDQTSAKILELEEKISIQQTQIEQLLEQFKKGDVRARNCAKEAIKAANAVEAHNRRWALRILGLKAPDARESTAEAKQIAQEFFTEKLKVLGITAVDIDCAHRVGQKDKEGRQTLLVRLFERDNVELLLSKKKLLKGSTLILYEDATYLDRKLLNALKDHPNVVSQWMHHGTIWARRVGAGENEKTKVQIFDDLDALFP